MICNIHGICSAKRTAKYSAEKNAVTELKWGYLKHLILLLVLLVKIFSCSKKLNLGHCQELLKTRLWAKIPFLRLTQMEICHFEMQD